MIIVFGSINMDINMGVRRFPEEGETVLTPSYTSTPGGNMDILIFENDKFTGIFNMTLLMIRVLCFLIYHLVCF